MVNTRRLDDDAIHARKHHALDAGEVFAANRSIVLRLERQVGLLDDAGDELAHVPDRIRQPQGRVQRDQRARTRSRWRRRARTCRAHVGAQHLDRDLGAVWQPRAVHLRHARRRHRLPIEFAIMTFERSA